MPTVAELMSLHADRVPPEATLAEAAALGLASVSVVQFQKLRVVLSSQLRAGERA